MTRKKPKPAKSFRMAKKGNKLLEGIVHRVDPVNPLRRGTYESGRRRRDTYMKWLNDRMTMRCMMRVAMNDELSRKFEDVQPEEIIQMLNESFDIPKDAERHKIFCAVFNARMREEILVTDHVLYMID